MTMASLPVFPAPCIYAGDFNCQPTTGATPTKARAETASPTGPAPMDLCSCPKSHVVSTLEVGYSYKRESGNCFTDWACSHGLSLLPKEPCSFHFGSWNTASNLARELSPEVGIRSSTKPPGQERQTHWAEHNINFTHSSHISTEGHKQTYSPGKKENV